MSTLTVFSRERLITALGPSGFVFGRTRLVLKTVMFVSKDSDPIAHYAVPISACPGGYGVGQLSCTMSLQRESPIACCIDGSRIRT